MEPILSTPDISFPYWRCFRNALHHSVLQRDFNSLTSPGSFWVISPAAVCVTVKDRNAYWFLYCADTIHVLHVLLERNRLTPIFLSQRGKIDAKALIAGSDRPQQVFAGRRSGGSVF